MLGVFTGCCVGRSFGVCGVCTGCCVGRSVGTGTTTLGGGLGTFEAIFSTLGSLGAMGCLVARFKICASLMYAFVVSDPYHNFGIVLVGSCKTARISAGGCSNPRFFMNLYACYVFSRMYNHFST